MNDKQIVERMIEINENHESELGEWKDAKYCMRALHGLLKFERKGEPRMTKVIMDRFGSIRKKTVHAEKAMLTDGLHFVCYHNCPGRMSDMECVLDLQKKLIKNGFDVIDIKKIEDDIKAIRKINNNRGFCRSVIIDDTIHVKYCFCG